MYDFGKVVQFSPANAVIARRAYDEFETKLPGNRAEFTRALVEILDGRGFHNLAFAIMKCATDDAENPLVNKEMDEFIRLAKTLLMEEIPQSA